jgi:hypothetical protein
LSSRWRAARRQQGAVEGGAVGAGEALGGRLADGLLGQAEQGRAEAVAEVVPAAARGGQAAQQPAQRVALTGVAVPLGGGVVAALRLEQDGGQQQLRRVGRHAAAGVQRPEGGQLQAAQGAGDHPGQVARRQAAVQGLPLRGGGPQRGGAEADAAGRAGACYAGHGVNSWQGRGVKHPSWQLFTPSLPSSPT